MLTTAQKATLKTHIQANSDTNALFVAGNLAGLADLLNLPAAPTYWAWRTAVPATDYKGAAGIVWAEVDALSAGKARIFEWLTGQLTAPINAADANVRQGILDSFASNSVTRANLIVLARRTVTRVEQLFAIDTPGSSAARGTTADPDTLTVEGPLDYTELIGLLD